MANARYFRVVSAEVYDKVDLVLSEFRLYASGSAADGTASLTSTVPPSSGSLANLHDGDTASACTFSAGEVSLPGFCLQWDFGSSATVDELRVTGPALTNFLHKFVFQSSSDATEWTDVFKPFPSTKWTDATTPWAALFNNVDPNWGTVVLALPFDGRNGSTTFVDISASPKTITAYGGARLSTSQYKYGGSSLELDGSGDYVEVPSHADFAFGTGEFAILFWLYLVSLSNGPMLIDMRPGANGNYIGGLGTSSDGSINYGANGSGIANSSAGALTTGAWQHVALCKSGTTGRIFINGTQVASGTDSINYAQTRMWIGRNVFTNSQDLNGYIEDLIVHKGASVHTADFTPTRILQDYDRTPDRPVLNVARRLVGPTVGNAQQSVNVRNPNATADNSNGPGTIAGTVKEKAIPSNLPLSRKVRLIRERDGKCVREMWSDPVTGAWAFTGLDLSQAYTAVAWDYEHTYRATIADNLAATR